MLKIQGIRATVTQLFADWIQSQISSTATSISAETMLPILFIADMAEVLSI